MTPPMAAPDAPQDEPVRYLTIREYSAEHDVHERTIKRWLANDELEPKPYQDPTTTQWFIPASAKRVPKAAAGNGEGVTLRFGPSVEPQLAWPQQPGTHLAPVPAHSPVVAHVPGERTVDEQIADLPTLMSLDEFLDVLNHGRPEDDPIMTRRRLIRMADVFGLIAITEREYLVPLSALKKLRGLASA